MSTKHRNAGGPFLIFEPGIGISGSFAVEGNASISGSLTIGRPGGAGNEGRLFVEKNQRIRGFGSAPSFQFLRGEGSAASISGATSGDELGRIQFDGYRGHEDTTASGAYIQAFAKEDFSATKAGTALTFSTVDSTTLIVDERMRIDHNGNIGIGTTTPQKTLTVRFRSSDVEVRSGNGLDGGGNGAGLIIHNDDSSGNAYSNLDLRTHSYDARIAAVYAGTPNDGRLAFITDGGSLTEAMTITGNDAGHNVGIGITAPLGKLHIKHQSTQAAPQITIHEDDTGYGRIQFQNTADTNGPNSLSHEWALAGMPKAQGSQADARFNIFYGDRNGSGSGADLLSATGVGNILMPHTCFVSVHPTADIVDMPVNAQTTIIFNGEDFDNQGRYNTSTGIFTAPVTGYYLSNLQIALKQIDTGFTYMWVGVFSDGTPQFGCFQRYNPNDFSADTDTNAVTRSGSTIFKLDAGDTLRVNFYQQGGTQQTDVAGQSNGAMSNWQIRLIG